MKLTSLIVFLCLIIQVTQALTGNIHIQEPDSSTHSDSAVRLYFVCESHHILKKTGIFENGDRIQVVDTLGRMACGILKILNGEKIEILSLKRLRDTFVIGSIQKVKGWTTARIILAGTALVIGTGGLGTGIGLIAYTGHGGSAAGAYLVGGFLISLISLPFEIVGTKLAGGKRYRSDHYTFRIIRTKGFELKKRHIKYL